jgi:GDP-L-fucose synthase
MRIIYVRGTAREPIPLGNLQKDQRLPIWEVLLFIGYNFHMETTAKIFVTGHRGMVGTALVAELQKQGFTNLLLATKEELDLLDQKAVAEFFMREKPEYVFHLAAKVGGIIGNRTYPADFIYENIQINNNVIHSAHEAGVKKLINFGSVCIYPVAAPTPIKEEYLLTGPLEVTNEAYAIAKIAGTMMAKKYKEQYGNNFISAMPCNLYGVKDNFDRKNAHVIPMLMRRFHEAKVNGDAETIVWGTGKPTRDFLNSQDVAEGLIFLMQNYDGIEHINIGPGVETSIKELAEMVKDVVGYEGNLTFDTTKPDGTPKRYLDTTKINELGWKSRISLREGLVEMYKWFVEHEKEVDER